MLTVPSTFLFVFCAFSEPGYRRYLSVCVLTLLALSLLTVIILAGMLLVTTSDYTDRDKQGNK